MSSALTALTCKSLLAVLNVNVPDVATANLRGFKATVLGEREAPFPPIKTSQNGGFSQYTLGPAGGFCAIKRSQIQDFEAVEHGYASITPLSVKFDDSVYVADVQSWLDGL